MYISLFRPDLSRHKNLTTEGTFNMGIADLGSVMKIFGGDEPTEEEQAALYKEVLLMVLARASSSDANIAAVEVTSIRKMLKKATGEEVSERQIRKAANSALYEKAPFRKYLGGVRKKLDSGDRAQIAGYLAELMKSDTRVSVLEIEFFNKVAVALEISPSELVGLVPEG
jgi:uncharacterized tellurite resistance protein B-like protein